MKMMTLVATAALLALSACDGADDGAANNAADSPANAAAPAAAAGGKDPAGETANSQDATAPSADGGPRATAASPSGEILALLIGRWTDSGECDDATDFRADGTFTSPVGNGRWTLESEYLTLSGAGPNAEVAIQVIDRAAMETVSPMGRIGRWTRC